MKKKLSILLLLTLILIICAAVTAEEILLTTTVPSEHGFHLSCGVLGTAEVNGTALSDGESIQIVRHQPVTINIIPKPGFEVDRINISSGYGVSLEGNTLTIEKMVDEFTAQVTFKRIDDPNRIPGDADGDGKVTELDALRIMQYDAGWEVEIWDSNADVNEDALVDSLDAVLILKHQSGENVTLK